MADEVTERKVFTKGQVVPLVSFTKGVPNAGLSHMRMGLRWQPLQTGSGGRSGFRLFGGGRSSGGSEKSIDLDASCIAFDDGGREMYAVWYSNLHSPDGAIRHSGDDRSGRGGLDRRSRDNESLRLDLDRVDRRVQTLVFTVNSFSGERFDQVASAACHLVEAVPDQPEVEIGEYHLDELGNHTGIVMAKVTRTTATRWEAKMIGELGGGRTYKDLVSLARRFI